MNEYTMPSISQCDRTEACPELLDHDGRCPKFDAAFWSTVKVAKRGETALDFPPTERD